MTFGRRTPSPEHVPAPLRGPSPEEQAESIAQADMALLQTTEAKFESVRVAIAQGVSLLGSTSIETITGDVQHAINQATNSQQGSKLAPENVRRYLELKRPKGHGR